MKNSRAYYSFNSVLSDHKVVSDKIKQSGNPMNHVYWKLVTSDQNLTNAYTVSVYNRFSELCTEETGPHDKYQRFTSCVEEVALNSLRRRKKNLSTQRSLSALESITKERELFHVKKNNFLLSPTEIAKAKVDKARNNLQTAYGTVTAEILQENINNISSLHACKQRFSAWKTINELTARKDKPSTVVNGGSTEKRKEGWLSHFKKLLGEAPKVTPDLPKTQVAEQVIISTSPFTLKELLVVVNLLSNRKASGPDNIPAIICKDTNFQPILLEICNHNFHTYDAPPLWLIIRYHFASKEYLSLFKNYRGISLTVCSSQNLQQIYS